VHLLHSTGARISEILALDLSDVDIENRKFQVLGSQIASLVSLTENTVRKYIKEYEEGGIEKIK
jgi:integrase/recombinase XerD